MPSALDAAAAEEARHGAPLPPPIAMGESGGDVILLAWRGVVAADARGDAGARATARLSLIDAWLDLGGVSAPMELLRELERLAPEHPAVLDRRAWLLTRTGQLREAAQQLVALARRRPSVTVWEAAVRAWVRADEIGEATACVEALQRVAPTEPRVSALALAVARLQSGPRRGAALVAQLVERASRARQRDERELWRALSLDAWLESYGGAGGPSLIEALAATGHPRAAVYVAIESAARILIEAPGDTAGAVALLHRAARLAESAGMPGEATAVWTVASLLPDPRAREAQEALRDLLAERGRVLELSVRLRADARRAPPASRAASWKGVAAVEMPVSPALAAHALIHALRAQPDDAEAMELLRAMSADPGASEAIRDGLWRLVRDGAPRALHTRALRWLGELEEEGGDPCSAEAAWAAIDEPLPEVFAGLARVHGAAEARAERAEQALAEFAASGGDAAVLEQILSSFSACPGALRDLRAVTRLLGPLAAGDGRVARLWMLVAVRQGDAGQRLAVARQVATRCGDRSARQRAVFDCIDGTDVEGADAADVVELAALLLDERPDDPVLAATLAALAEHGRDPVVVRDALRALAVAAPDPWERDVLARFDRVSSGVFEVFAACLAEPAASAERSVHLARLHDLVGDSAQLLALRTRALLAQSGAVEEGLAVARQFAAFEPLSAEAAIAWFGAASLAGDVAQLAQAAVAVTASLTTHRDIAAVTRTAVTRLASLNALPRAGEIALTASGCGALADRGLRAAVSDLAMRLEPGIAARLLEVVDASAETAAERSAVLRQLAGRYHALGLAGAELGAWQRAAPMMPAEALGHLVRLAPRCGDRGWNAQLLTQQLDGSLDPTTRRRLLLAVASEYAAATPPRLADAMSALDRLAMEQSDHDVREVVVSAMLSLAQTDAAIGRLTRWAAEQPEPGAVTALLLRAARLASDGLGDPYRALALLRGLLRHEPAHAEALELAEELAVRSGASEAILAIYADLLDHAAGPHGRRAVLYRRAFLHERMGADESALRGFVELFDAQPAIGAPLSALERVGARLGRFDVVLRALESLARGAPPGPAQARVHQRAAQVARERLGDLAVALQQELLAYQADPTPTAAAALRASARAAREKVPSTAVALFEHLTDAQLALGNQSWEDDTRRAHAEVAIEIAVADGVDPYRAAAAVGLYLRQHPEPRVGRDAVRAIVERAGGTAEMRAAALESPAMLAPLAPASEVGPNPASAPPESESFGDLNVPSVPPPVPEPTAAPPLSPVPPPPDPTGPRASSPPPRTSAAEFDGATLVALRAAASFGNDAAASVLAERLSSSEDLRDEALEIQRRRFHEDPARLDALEAMIALQRSRRRTSEMAALTQVLLALRGRSETVIAPELIEVDEAPEGVARVVFPQRLGPFPELGATLWEVIGGVARRSADRTRFSEARAVAPNSVLGRSFAAALRLLQLPRGTALALHDRAVTSWAVNPTTQPPTLVLSDEATRDTDRLRWLLGSALESTRAAHLVVTAFEPAEAERWVRAVAMAFGSGAGDREEPAVASLAGRIIDGLPARGQRRMQDLVEELGPRLSYGIWRDAIAQAQSFAGMLVSGSFPVAAEELIAGSTFAGASPTQLLTSWEPLRDLCRFATSEEYLMLRWSLNDGARRRR